jgi:integrase
MPQKADHTHHILEGKAILYQRSGTPHWQVRYKVGGKWLRATTKQEKLNDAKSAAVELITNAWFREKNDLPVINKRFKAVANLAIKRMVDLNNSGNGKPTYKQYIHVINKYLIEFFGKFNIDKIDHGALERFNSWRIIELGHKPSQSTINTHNSALNRVFDEALMRGFITKAQVPHLENRGVSSDRRPDFTEEEYRELYKIMRPWVRSAREGQEKRTRSLLQDYVLILANTGMRAGTEAMNLKWKHLSFVKQDGKEYLTLNITGKTGHREIQVRHRVARYFERIQERDPSINQMTFEELIKKGPDKYIFRINNKDATTRLGRVFGRLLEESGLLIDKRTNKERTLYSLRHFYATRMLTRTDVTPYQLAEHMGTSVGMIEKYYGHLNLRKVADKFAGPGRIRDELSKRAANKSVN